MKTETFSKAAKPCMVSWNPIASICKDPKLYRCFEEEQEIYFMITDLCYCNFYQFICFMADQTYIFIRISIFLKGSYSKRKKVITEVLLW